MVKHESNPVCGCGGLNKTHHVADLGCYREVVESPTYIGQTEKGINMWRVGLHSITEFTLIQQRGYHHHGKGIWSRAKGYSENSVGEV
jgi:hypothetical protein